MSGWVLTPRAARLRSWDLKGKFLDLPLYQLLGGKAHEKLRAYA